MKLNPTKLRHQCPICTDTSGKCRTSDRLVLCMTNPDGRDVVAGYRYLKPNKNGLWGEYVQDEKQTAYSTIDRDRRQAKRAKQALELEIQRANSLSLEARDQGYRELLSQLTLADRDRQDLLRRGLNHEQIDQIGYKSVTPWQKLTKPVNPFLPGVTDSGTKLTVTGRGYLIPITNTNGLIIGLKLRLRDVVKKGNRYLWLKSSDTITAHLPNGELPIGVYRPDKVKISNRIGIAEGEIKPQIAAIALGQTFIGASGGLFTSSPKQIEQALNQLEQEHINRAAIAGEAVEPLEIIIYPDAGSHGNNGVMNRLKETWNFITNLGHKVKIAYWNQLYKGSGDIDELTNYSIIEYFDKWTEFEALGLYQLRQPDLVMNERYLSLSQLAIPSDRFGVAVKSDKGTGKTESQKYLTKIAHQNYDQPRPVLYLTTHTSLVQQGSDRLGIVNHYELEACKSDLEREALIYEASVFGIATTYDSLHKLEEFIPDFTPFYTMLDETESSIKYMLSSTTDLKNRRTETINQLTEILSQSQANYPDGHVFMFDEALTNVSVDYILGMVGQTVNDAYIIRNDYRVAQGRCAYEYQSPNDWLHAYSSTNLTSDRTICYTTSQKPKSKTSTHNLAELTGNALTIDAHTTTDPDHVAFKILQTDPALAMNNYLHTIHTSTMGVGFSIDKPDLFASKWLISYGLIGTTQLLQGTDRYRSNIDLHYFVPKRTNIGKTGTGSCNWETLAKQAVKNTNQHAKELQELDIESKSLNNSYKTWAKLEARQNLELANYRPMLRLKLRSEGYEIREYQPTDTNKVTDINKASDRLAEIADTNYKNHCINIENADISDSSEMQSLGNKRFLTEPQRHKLEKQKLSDRYRIPVTAELVKANDDGLHPKLRRQYYLNQGRDYLSERDKAILQTLKGNDNLVFAPDASKSLLSASIAILDKIGVNKFIESIGNDWISNDDDRVTKFNKVLISDFYRYPLRRLIGITINPTAKPLTNIKKVLESLGYEFQSDQKAIAKKKSSAVQLLPTPNLYAQILEAWLNYDIEKSTASTTVNHPVIIRNRNAETQIPRREFPNNLLYREFPTEIPDGDQFPTPENLSPNGDQNESVDMSTMRSPSDIIPKLRHGMKVLLDGTQWIANIIGTATVTLKSISGRFEHFCSDEDIGNIEILDGAIAA